MVCSLFNSSIILQRMVMASSCEPSLGEIPAAVAGVGSSDHRISSLFDEISRSLRIARRSNDLTNLRQLLNDINYELTKYGNISLRADSWRSRIEDFVTNVLHHVQIQPAFLLDIRDIENDTAAMIEHLADSIAEQNGIKDRVLNLQWHLKLAKECASTPSLTRIRAYGYYKLGDLSQHLPITPEILSEFIPVMVFLLNGFKEDDSGVAKSASDSTLSLVKHFNITNILHPGFEYARKLVEIIDQTTISGARDVVKFRLFEFVEKLLADNLANVTDVIQLGLMEKLFSSFRTMDLLTLANNCETLAKFAESSNGLQLLEESGGMRLAEDLLEAKKSSTDLEYFAPYLYRLYISLATKHPEYCILKREKVTLLSRELILHHAGYSGAAAMEFISQLASHSIAGKRYLYHLKLGNGSAFMKELLELIGKTLSGTIGQTPMDDACLRDFGFLLKRVKTPTPESDMELQTMNHSWFNSAGMNLFSALFQKVRSPFKEVKMPILNIFLAMADQAWGMAKFRDEPGFMEFLMNRQAETDMEVKEVKFTIIEALVGSPSFGDVFDGVTQVRLREYIRDGPFYIPGQHHVASEGGI